MELILAVARSLQQRRQHLRSPQALAILIHVHAAGRRSRRSGQVPAPQIARRHCLVNGRYTPAACRGQPCGSTEPGHRPPAANPIARLAPPPAQAPAHLPRHPRQDEAPVLRGPLRSVTSTPDQPVPGPDRDRDRLSRIARAAVRHIAGQLPCSPARRRHPRTGALGRAPIRERAGDPRPRRPSRIRHALPNRRPDHQRTRPSPPARLRHHRGRRTGTRGMHARLTGARQTGTCRRRGPSVAVRETADGAHRP